MNYVADRLLEKVSDIDLGDVAAGTAATGLGALAYGAPRLHEAADPALEGAQTTLEKDKTLSSRQAGRKRERANVFRRRAAEAAAAYRKTPDEWLLTEGAGALAAAKDQAIWSAEARALARAYGKHEALVGGARKGLELLASTPGRLGVAALAAALGAAGTYGALKD